MRINHNIASLNTYRQLTVNTQAGSKSLEKLSSGFRINRAGDDAAGLAISEKMRGQIRGLDQASRNAQDGISLIQTAEGALTETHSILQRMRELSVQGANDTLTSDDRTKIQEEIDNLLKEVDRISTTTEFNTKKLLNNDLAGATTAKATQLKNTTGLAAATKNATTFSTLKDADGNSIALSAGDKITITGTKGGAQFTITLTVTATDTLAEIATALVGGNYANAATFTSGVWTIDADTTGLGAAIGAFTITAKSASGVERTAFNNAMNKISETQTAANAHQDGSASVQIGANSNQTLDISINDMGKVALGVSGVTVKTRSSAQISITSVDEAIKKVSTERSKLGALQNRLEHTINNLGASAENLTASESRIRDVDMAKEMMEFTKNNILNQAATAMLAQANQQPQAVLQLLR